MSSCYDKGHSLLFYQHDSTKACVADNSKVRSLWDNAPLTSSINEVMTLELSSMVNESELLINVVINEQPKMLRGCNQNGKWSSSEVQLVSDVDVAPPAKRQHLTYSGTHVERGKPDVLP